MSLEYLKNKEIDKEKWDAGIARSTHPLIYAESWYLDIVSPGWHAVVNQDYSILFPLPINRKWRIPFIMQPLFAQQLGLFSQKDPDNSTLETIGKLIRYPAVVLQGNSKNALPRKLTNLTRHNYKLSLHHDYNQIQKSFTKNCHRNIKKALHQKQYIKRMDSVEDFINFSSQNIKYKVPTKTIPLLEKIIRKALARDAGFIISSIDGAGDDLAMAFFLKKHGRIIFLFGNSTDLGFKKQSMFFIMNYIIEQYSKQDIILDFEGSEIEGIARFYKGFGAETESYDCFERRWLTVLRRAISYITSL